MNKPTPEQVRASIVPKSDQLNADDLLTGPQNVTITKVREGDRDHPLFVDLEGYTNRPYKPCKIMRRVLIAVFSDDAAKWVGQAMTLYRDPNVKWAGVKVGGIRISHLSGLDTPRTFTLTVGRGIREEVTIQPLKAKPAISPEEQAYIDGAKEQIEKASDLDTLGEIGAVLKSASKAAQSALRPLYTQRKKELEDG